VRVYRNNNLPQVGKEAAAKILTPANTQLKWEPLDADVAKSSDVAYTHGTYEVVDAEKRIVEKGSYVRIWRKHSNVWKIVIDVTNPH
jgi:ketosteroid isomerase-like protein